MASNPAESALLTPPQPNRIKQRLPEASPFTAFLKHLPDLTPPKSSTYNSYSSFAFTVQSPAPSRLQSHQTPAKARAGDQDHEAAPFANILALADLKATPVKPEEPEGFGYRGNGGETPYGLRSPIPLFHESPRRPGPGGGGSPTPGKLAPQRSEVGRELRELAASGGRGTSGSSSGVAGAGGPLGSLGSPHLISSAFAALLEGHSRSSPGAALSMLGGGGGGAGGTARSFSPLFSPSKQSPNGGSSLGPSDRRGSGGSAAEDDTGPAAPSGGNSSEQRGGGSGSNGGREGDRGTESQQQWRPRLLGQAGTAAEGAAGSQAAASSGGGGGGLVAAAAASTPPLPPFFSPNPLSRVPLSLERGGGSYRTGSSSGALVEEGTVGRGHGGANAGANGNGGSDLEEEGHGMVGDDDIDDEDYVMDEDDPSSDAEPSAGAAGQRGGGGGSSHRGVRPPAESPRVVRQRPGGGSMAAAALPLPDWPGRCVRGGGVYNGVPGAPRRRVGQRVLHAGGSSADSLAAQGGYATDDDVEPTPLVHAMLPQSPMCVPLNLDAFLPIPKLRHSESRADGAAEGDDGSPSGRPTTAPPLPFDSPAVKAATNAAITAALEAAVGPASSSGASGSARGARVAERGRSSAARAAAAAAAAAVGAGSAPLTRRQSNTSSARGHSQSFLSAQATDEALLARMISLSNKKCNCKKSKCLKLYCDCFAGGGFCGPHCSCAGCANRADNMDVVVVAREQIASRNPNAFKEKIEADPSLGGQHRRGCNCKKSHCMKKYCECFSAGVPCGEHCKCEGCHNTPDSFKRGGPGGRGRRAAQAAAIVPAAAAAAAPPLPPGAAAAAMRAGAFPILIPAGPGARGMAMSGAAAARAGGTGGGSRGVATDAAAALALGGALQFLLPLSQQQAAAAVAGGGGDVAAALHAGSEGPPGVAAAAAAARQTTPSPPPPGSGALSPEAPVGPAASSPQMLQIFSMLQASGGPGVDKPPNMVSSNGQLFVPLMWPFNGGTNGAAGQPPLPTLTPQALPQANSSAAMRALQQATALPSIPSPPQAQPSGSAPGEALQQHQPVAGASAPPAAAAGGVAAATAGAGAAEGLGREGAAGLGAQMVDAAAAAGGTLPSLLPSPSFSFLPGNAAALAGHGEGHTAAEGLSPLLQPKQQQMAAAAAAGEAEHGKALQPGPEQQRAVACGGSSSSAPQSPPGAGPPPGAGVGVFSPAAHIRTPLGAAAPPVRPPAAVSDMDLSLDSPRVGELPSPAAAAAAAAAAKAGAAGCGAGTTWLQAGAVPNGRTLVAGGEEPLGPGRQAQHAQQQQQAQQQPALGLTTRKRAREGDAQRATISGSGEQQPQGSGGADHHHRPPPASPRATPTKRKPLRTITSALM